MCTYGLQAYADHSAKHFFNDDKCHGQFCPPYLLLLVCTVLVGCMWGADITQGKEATPESTLNYQI
jgi:hypothetical protein